MRLFISYARDNKNYCTEIAKLLARTHEVWVDDRIHMGQNWWEEIVKQIVACDGFILLVSPDSLESEYCKQELNLARAMHKMIFPVLITPGVSLPEHLAHLQYADVSKGLTSQSVSDLLTSLQVAERRARFENPFEQPEPVFTGRKTQTFSTYSAKPSINPETLVDEVTRAVDHQDFERAILLLRQAKDSGISIRFIDLDEMLYMVEKERKRHEYLREAEREYRPIVAMIRSQSMRRFGCEAFLRFAEQYPDYDPDNVRLICNKVFFPLAEWCIIPAGEVTLIYDDREVVYHVDRFKISKYPVTNEQFHIFVKDPDGYCNPEWWRFSREARAWREEKSKPIRPKFPQKDHPRENISWYEAVAYTHWLSAHLGISVMLPSEEQWQRAAQGDDKRVFPWGNRFDPNRCNSIDSKMRTTLPVNHSLTNMSPFGVVGMVGNVWEWCINGDEHSGAKVVRGGSFISPAERCTTTFRYLLNPRHRYATIGFRVVTKE
ncbi:MAG: hypothetical protein CUN56_01990 [Phototrophicales bacterium]|nr:MAG: hypothetical protein CUN56_01990 [Phototrophicales bacterium]RMG71550.1 MAG: TIR domain-containing protein [Chloroflexota bacterium]